VYRPRTPATRPAAGNSSSRAPIAARALRWDRAPVSPAWLTAASHRCRRVSGPLWATTTPGTGSCHRPEEMARRMRPWLTPAAESVRRWATASGPKARGTTTRGAWGAAHGVDHRCPQPAAERSRRCGETVTERLRITARTTRCGGPPRPPRGTAGRARGGGP
jgi:hypothetical protein